MLDKIRKFLESKYATIFILAVSYIFQLFRLPLISLGFMVLMVAGICFICYDIKNIFAVIFFIPFCIEDVEKNAPIPFFVVCVLIALAAIIFYIVKSAKNKSFVAIKGKFYLPLIVASAAFLLGGIVGNFRIDAFIVILGMCFINIVLYFVALNFTKNLNDYLLHLFFYGAIFVAVEFLTLNAFNGNIISSITSRSVFWIGAECINTAAIYLCLGMISAFAIGNGKKQDWIWFIAATVLALVVVLTYCRTMILLTALAYIFLLVLAIKKSTKKLNYLWVILGMLGFVGIGFAIFHNQVINAIKSLIEKAQKGANGRDELWPWCWEKFKEYPIFGYGFLSREDIPGVRNAVAAFVLAHNSILQILTSLGLVGLGLMAYYYYKKYKIMFTKLDKIKIFTVVALIVIELSGMFDQAAFMDYFVHIMPMIFIASMEQYDAEKIKTIEK